MCANGGDGPNLAHTFETSGNRTRKGWGWWWWQRVTVVGVVFMQVGGGMQPHRPQGKGGMYWRLRRSEGVSGRGGFKNGVWRWVGDGVCVALITTEIFDGIK